MSEKQHQSWRYAAIAVLFCLACVIYLGRLFYIQISGRDNQYASGTTVKRVTIQAVRGEIYDRNGNALVTNQYTYDLILSGNAFATLSDQRANDVCLQLLDALDSTAESNKHVEKFFPLEGAYPYYHYRDEATDGESVIYYRLRRVLGDVGLKTDATAKELVDHYVQTYGLLAVDEYGFRLYDDDEIDSLIRLRYDMDALRFGATTDYTVAPDVSLMLMTFVKELNLDATSFLVNVERTYNYPGYASHILGTVGPIYSEEWEYYNELGYQMNAIVGKTGCEYAFEQYLHGSDGLMEIVEDAAGNIVSTKMLTEPIAGSDVHLTIDIHLQIAAEDGLAENVESVVLSSGGMTSLGSGCNAGAAVAMDPNTFDVLAIASYPTYDLSTYNLLYNDLAANSAKPLLNRALNGSYAPGSTFKLGVAVAGLMEGKINTSSTIVCNGVYDRYSDYRPKCSTYGTHQGAVDAVTAIKYSCNCFFYELGYRLGIDSMNDYMSHFGLGESTGLELGGTTGVLAGPDYRLEIHHPDEWTEGMVLSAAIGQSDNTSSPLQLACYLSTIVNGGSRYSAHLLNGVYSFGADTPVFSYVQSEQTLLNRTEIPENVLSTVLRGMREVISGNRTVSNHLKNVPVTVGGKTGTAQNSSGCENALFVCAAPYDNPEIVISVVLEQGYSGGNASLTAARILEEYYGVNK